MNTRILLTSAALALVSLGLTGCGKKGGLPSVLAAWQQGDKPAATRGFVETDWKARPVFAPGTAAALTEAQFQALAAPDRDAKLKEVLVQVQLLRELAAAVMKAGEDAAAKNDTAEARKCFTAVKEYGAAIKGAGSVEILTLVGRAIKNVADKGLAKLGS